MKAVNLCLGRGWLTIGTFSHGEPFVLLEPPQCHKGERERDREIEEILSVLFNQSIIETLRNG